MPRNSRIALFASGAVFEGPKKLFAYVAAKTGLLGFARCLAEELGDDWIAANMILPRHRCETGMSKDIASPRKPISRLASSVDALLLKTWWCRRLLYSLVRPDHDGQTLCIDCGSVKR